VSIYLDAIINNMMGGGDGSIAICHNKELGWFMFDVDKSEERTEVLWTKDLRNCLLFLTEEAAQQFLVDVGLSQKNHITVDVGKLHADTTT
jgi:hypothetical protein